MRQHTALLESSVAFLMAPNGNVLASTDDGGRKRRGENFGFLPYFQDSSAYGLVGKDLAVEPDLEQRGYYVSHPVLGVAVVKKVLAQTDKEFKRFRNWFLVSPGGFDRQRDVDLIADDGRQAVLHSEIASLDRRFRFEAATRFAAPSEPRRR